MRVVTIIDLHSVTIIDGIGRFRHGRSTGGLFSLLRVGVPFPVFARWRNGNAPLISLRPPLITEHHFVSSINDRAREVARRSAKLCPRPRITKNTLLACPQSDHDLRRHSTGDHQQSCSEFGEFASVILTAHTRELRRHRASRHSPAAPSAGWSRSRADRPGPHRQRRYGRDVTGGGSHDDQPRNCACAGPQHGHLSFLKIFERAPAHDGCRAGQVGCHERRDCSGIGAAGLPGAYSQADRTTRAPSRAPSASECMSFPFLSVFSSTVRPPPSRPGRLSPADCLPCRNAECNGVTSGLTSNELRRMVSPEINPCGVHSKPRFFFGFRLRASGFPIRVL